MNEENAKSLEKFRMATQPTRAVAFTVEDAKLIERLNANLLSHYKFKIELVNDEAYYADCRKEKPFRINRTRPLKSIDEVLKFMGIAIQKVYLRENELFKLYKPK